MAAPDARVVAEKDVEPAAFLASAGPFLRDGREFLLLGIASMAVARFPATEYFVVRRRAEVATGDGEEAEVVMVGLRTTPTFKFLVSRATDDAAPEALADAIADHCAGSPPVGLLGPADVSERAALRLAQRFGTGPPSAGMAERYLAAVATREPPHGMPQGELRRADIDPAADGALLAGWCEAFEEDVGIETAMRKPGTERLQDYRNDLWVWCAPHEDSATPQPVAMAAVAGDSTTVGAQRISLVYTPPDCRRRGYAGAAVHALTAALLADGAQPYLGIVTDAANPTSNHVYESVGFEHVADGQNWLLNSL